MTDLTLWRVPTWPARVMPRFDSLWEDLMPDMSASTTLVPRVDVTREDGHFKLTAEFPGVSKEDIHLDVMDGVLILRGEKKREVEEESNGCRFSERSYGSFERSFRLPPETNVDEIHAELTKGILTVTIPVHEPETKKIDVKEA